MTNKKQRSKIIKIIFILGVFVIVTIALSKNYNNSENSKQVKLLSSSENQKEYYKKHPINCMLSLYPSKYNEWRKLMDEKIYDGFELCKKMKDNSKKDPIATITRINNMNTARGEDQITLLLDNGNVLIIGGNKTNDFSVEVFDIQTNSFIEVQNNNLILNNNVSFLKDKILNAPIKLNNGSFFIRGTTFNPNKNIFEAKNSKLAKILRRYLLALISNNPKTQLHKIFLNGKFLIKKNCKQDPLVSYPTYICSQVVLIDPINNVKYKTGTLKFPRNNFNAMLLDNDDVLIAGGSAEFGTGLPNASNTIEIYTPSNGKTKILKTLKYNILKNGVYKVENYLFIIVEDSNIEILNVKKDHLSSLLKDYNFYLPLSDNYFSITSLKNNLLLIINSYVYLYNLDKETFTELNSVYLNYFKPKCTFLQNGNVLITGGYPKMSRNAKPPSRFAAILSFNKYNK